MTALDTALLDFTPLDTTPLDDAHPVHEWRGWGMGTEVHLAVAGGPPDLLDRMRDRLADLEARWSRFLPDSVVSRLNERAGRVTPIDADTFDLLLCAGRAHALTGGSFEPLVGRAVVDAGYDRDIDVVRGVRCADESSRTMAPRRPTRPTPSRSAPCWSAVELDPLGRTARLPTGSAIDLGGIAKGFAADLVTRDAIDLGADAVLVNVGGDLRVRSAPGADTGVVWPIDIVEPAHRDEPFARLLLVDGAVATSTTLRRRWGRPGAERHHIIDPRTSSPCDELVVVATCVATDAWWAESNATATVVDGGPPAAGAAPTLLVRGDGTVERLHGFDRYETGSATLAVSGTAL